MANYIRTKHPGATLFFTVRLADRHSDLLIQNVGRLRTAMRLTRMRYPFEITEVVVMPSVIHTIWTLPPDDADFSIRWRMLKSYFSRGVPAPLVRNPATQRRGEKGIWQRRFWEHHLRDEDDIAAHRHMIFCAPVQAGLAARPQDWRYSSIHRAMREGTYDAGPIGAAYAPYHGQQNRNLNQPRMA